MKKTVGKMLGVYYILVLIFGNFQSSFAVQNTSHQESYILVAGGSIGDFLWNITRDKNEKLLRAVKENNQGDIEKLLEKGADVNARDLLNKRTPLLIAAQLGNVAIFKRLLDDDADIKARDLNDNTALTLAAYGHSEAIMAAATRYKYKDRDRGFGLEQQEDNAGNVVFEDAEGNIVLKYSENSDGSILLKCTANHGHLEIIMLLLEQGVDANTQSHSGGTALIHVISSSMLHLIDNVETMEYTTYVDDTADDIIDALLRHGANVNLPTDDGYTALMAAVRCGHLDLVERLLNNGADVNLKDHKGRTALTYAQENNQTEMIELLTNAGAIQ